MKGVLFIDGGCRPTNPGRAGFACVLKREGEPDVRVARYAGWKSNNEVEYMALIVGIKIAADNGVKYLSIFTDSQLLVGHMTKNWRRAKGHMRVLAHEAESLLRKHYQTDEGEILWRMEWIKRTGNKEADALCTAVIKAAHDNNPWRRRLRGYYVDVPSEQAHDGRHRYLKKKKVTKR